MKKKANFALTLFMLATLLSISACSQSANTTAGNTVANKETITFGLIAPLTGDAANFGEAVQNGLAVFEEELRGQDSYFNYKFVVEDDQLQNTKTVSAFQKVTSVDGANAVIVIASGAGNAISSLAENKKVLTCAIASDDKIVLNRTYVFKHWVTPQKEAEKYVQEMRRRGYKTAAIVGTNQQGVKAAMDEVDKLIHDDILTYELIEPSITDFRTTILKLKQEKPDTLLVEFLPGQLTAFMRQLEEASYAGDVSSIESFEYESSAIPYLEGRWYVNSAEELGNFKASYEKKFSQIPLVGSGQTYDCLKMMMIAYEKAESKDPDAVMKELRAMKDYNGALGPVYLDDMNSVQSNAAVKEVRNGKFVVVG